jgi:hypothetical protein
LSFSELIKGNQEGAGLLLVLILLVNILVWLPFYEIDPHSAEKCEYYYGHSGTAEAERGVVWNRNLHSGMPQYDQVFWHYLTPVYTIFQSEGFQVLVTVLGSLGVYIFFRLAGYGLLAGLLSAFFYGLSAHFLEFLPVWVYGWRLMLAFLPWIAVLLKKLKEKGSLIDISLLAVLFILTFLLFETEIIIYLLVVCLVYLLYSFIDSFDYEGGIWLFLEYFWKLSLAIVLAAGGAVVPYLQIFKARNLNIIDSLTNLDSWRLTGVILVIALLFLAVRLGRKSIALVLGSGLLLTADMLVLINYLPNLSKYPQYDLTTAFDNTLTEYLAADSTQYRLYPVGKEFYRNRWTKGMQSIGGKDRFSYSRYQKILNSTLATEIDKNLEINWHLLAMLNVKYLISKAKIPSDRLEYANFCYQDQLILYKIKQKTRYAWFAEELKLMPIARIINGINKPEYQPYKSALIEKKIPQFSDSQILPVSQNAKITIKEIKPERIRIHTVNDSAGFLVLSEIFDEQDGWKAYIDSVQTEIYPVNYILRGIVTHPGKHLIELVYEPAKREFYHKVSYAARMLILIIFLTGITSRLWLKLF